jgi:hypothetical protein
MSTWDLQWSVTSRRSGFVYRKRGRNGNTKRKLFFVPTFLKYNHNGMRKVKKLKNTETPVTLTNKEKESENKKKEKENL